METSSQRAFTRVPVQLQAEVRGAGITIGSAATQSLSLKGVFISCSEKLPVDTECQITLFLGDEEVQIHAEGRVIPGDIDGIALQFTRIFGLESFEHLQKLVLYNAPDSDPIDLEFKASTGPRPKV